MKISFKDLPCNLTSHIYVDDLFVGEVHKDIFSDKWAIRAGFKVNKDRYTELKCEYFSCYKAGKTLAEVYSKNNSRKRSVVKDDFDLGDFSLDDVLSFLKFER